MTYDQRHPGSLDVAITAAEIVDMIHTRHGCSSESRAAELRRAAARLITSHMSACAVEFMAETQQAIEHMTPEQRTAELARSAQH